jgi:Na+-translocating ferredoxin:NAD+ oxidoreductase RnfE subunit
MQYVKLELLILIPFLIGLGQVIKLILASTSSSKPISFLKKMIRSTSRIPYFIWAAGFLCAAIYGFLISPYNGWKFVVDGLFATGFVQGSVVAWTAMGLYDTAKKKE